MLRAASLSLLMVLLLNGCGSLGDKAPGLGNLDTITAEDKEEEAWFKSFYGKEHCGVSQGVCKPGQSGSDSGTGGFWGVAGTPDGPAHDYGSSW